MTQTTDTLLPLLTRIADALERLAPAPARPNDLDAASAFVWQPDGHLEPIARINRVDLGLLKGIERNRDILAENSRRFAAGLPANNALVGGARGMGKSSLVKALHAQVVAEGHPNLKLIEIHREDIPTLPVLLRLLRARLDIRCLLFCDDLSFDQRRCLLVVIVHGDSKTPLGVPLRPAPLRTRGVSPSRSPSRSPPGSVLVLYRAWPARAPWRLALS